MKRITLVLVLVAGFFLASFGVCMHFGWFTPAWTRDFLVDSKPEMVAATVFGLLAVDLLLPVPSSVVLSAAGMLADWQVVAAAGTGGMLTGNLIGYWVCRLAGRRAFEKFVKPEEARKFGKWLDRYGPAALVVSRLVPVMAETLSCMAGAARMHFGRFLAGLLIGTIPFAIFFAVLGKVVENPGLVLIIALAVPAAGWLVFALFTRKSAED
jgi:membrane protein DedA with SNARE-associated domain